MRQLIVQVPADQGERVLGIATEHDATNSARLRGADADGREVAVVVLHVSNAAAGPLMDALEAVPALHVSMLPTGALALRPPATDVASQVTDVAPRSPLEVFIAGLQSIGAWKGFLAYAAVAGTVVWLGLVTNSVYLLVGAMLIAPFAGPAVNTAIATARGDAELLRHSLLRYGVALAVTAAVAALLSLAFRQTVATETMAAVSTISATAVLLPLAAGAAGALHLCQGRQSSLVSGAASGMLIAASLAPPAGIVGMAAVSGDHDLLRPALFLLGLQLVGINLAGSTVFRLFGLTPRGVRYARGRPAVRRLALLATAAGLAALLAWQFASPSPVLRHATVAQRLHGAVRSAIAADGRVSLVAAELRFTRPDIPGQTSLLAVLHVQRRPGVAADDASLDAHVSALVARAVRERAPNVTPLVAVTVLSGGR